MTTAASAVLFRSESKGSGFNANERPYTGNPYNSNFFSTLKMVCLGASPDLVGYGND